MNYRIQVGDQKVAETLEKNLLLALQQTLPQATNQQFVLQTHSENGQLVAGLTASSSYGWLLIKILWVDQAHRKQGLASELLEAAEKKALEIGCHACWLDTSNPKAKDFYLKNGFEEFAELKNIDDQFPQHHRRWFMRKTLS